MLCVCFFFFQAEDGIRDIGVTGVQTCALPIYVSGVSASEGTARDIHREAAIRAVVASKDPRPRLSLFREPRSEERRGGKECDRWGTRSHPRANRDRNCSVFRALVLENARTQRG